MDRGLYLSAANRRNIRQLVNRVYKQHPDSTEAAKLIKEYYWGWRPFIVYALSYLGALQTTEPLDLNRVRDSRS